MGTPWIYRLCSVRDDLVRRQATWQAAANAAEAASQPGIERTWCNLRERERGTGTMWWQLVKVEEGDGEGKGEWREREGREECRGGVCAVLGLVVGAMRVVSE